MSRARPTFEPSPYSEQHSTCSPLTSEGGGTWLPLICCPADFPLEVFEIAISQLIHHPEYNSTLILRSETISEFEAHFPSIVPSLSGLSRIRTVHRKLLPRRPGRDAGLEQYCTLYGRGTCTDGDDHPIPSTLVLTPITEDGSPLPYYHPAVSHLAFRYITSEETPVLRIEVIPLTGTPTDLNSRLYRTCLALLDALHRYGWGAVTDYKKRVMHDRLVPREAYQDLYLVMRERHKHLVDQWQEVTDPLKHVFEDIGIATYLMLLWKDSFDGVSEGDTVQSEQPWRAWGRPPGGFLDLGCGNGLLTHILTTEGYEGVGVDLRARISWDHYPLSTQARLRVYALDPTTLPSPTEDDYLKPGVFIIGNHADELTPWVPVLSTIYSASGYLSIPCCAWTFDMRYDRSSTAPFAVPASDFPESLNLGGDGNNSSSYSMYRIWLASLNLHCGWEVECDVLRIPSTRNWAIVGEFFVLDLDWREFVSITTAFPSTSGRKRRTSSIEEDVEFKRNAEVIVHNTRERGVFKTRKPEGKRGDH